MDCINHLWPDIADLTPRLSVAWCSACQHTSCAIKQVGINNGVPLSCVRWKVACADPTQSSLPAIKKQLFWDAIIRETLGLLRFLKAHGFSVQDVRDANSCNGLVLGWIAANGSLGVLQTLTDLWRLSLGDMRSHNNVMIKEAARHGHAHILHFLRQFKSLLAYPTGKRTRKGKPARRTLTAQDARADNNYALMWAAHNGHVAALQALQQFGLTIEDVRTNNNCAVRWAAGNGHVPVLQLFREWGLTLQDVRADDNHILRMAAESGIVGVLQFLKEWGLTQQDARACDNEALQLAAKNGHVGVLQFLKEWGLTQQDARARSNSAMFLATYFCRMDVLIFLKNEWHFTHDDALQMLFTHSHYSSRFGPDVRAFFEAWEAEVHNGLSCPAGSS
jgi:hypothetical protein